MVAVRATAEKEGGWAAIIAGGTASIVFRAAKHDLDTAATSPKFRLSYLIGSFHDLQSRIQGWMPLSCDASLNQSAS
jgi:hypothetical protein